MSGLSGRDVAHIFEALRKGLVPERGIDAFAVGIERERDELLRQLDLARNGEGTIKFLRGGYGGGKTFMARLAALDAQTRNFATSFVVVSDNDLKFHKFDDVYHKVMTELGTTSCPRGALGDILDRWIGQAAENGGEAIPPVVAPRALRLIVVEQLRLIVGVEDALAAAWVHDARAAFGGRSIRDLLVDDGEVGFRRVLLLLLNCVIILLLI